MAYIVMADVLSIDVIRQPLLVRPEVTNETERKTKMTNETKRKTKMTKELKRKTKMTKETKRKKKKLRSKPKETPRDARIDMCAM